MDKTWFMRRYLLALALVRENMPGRVLSRRLRRPDHIVVRQVVNLLRVYVLLLPLLQVLVRLDFHVLSQVLLLLLEPLLQVFGAHDEGLHLSELADVGIVGPVIDPGTRVASLD